jgi:hypothetical protein
MINESFKDRYGLARRAACARFAACRTHCRTIPENLKKRAQRGDFPAYKEGKQWRVAKSALMEHVGSAGTSSQCPNETTR